jgi:hypothetical protein
MDTASVVCLQLSAPPACRPSRPPLTPPCPFLCTMPSTRQFPFLIDPNNGKQLYESDDIINYLFTVSHEQRVIMMMCPLQLHSPHPIVLATGLLRVGVFAYRCAQRAAAHHPSACSPCWPPPWLLWACHPPPRPCPNPRSMVTARCPSP